METRRAKRVVVHPSRLWSKRQSGVGGQWQPASKLEFCQTDKQDSLPSWECMQAIIGGAES